MVEANRREIETKCEAGLFVIPFVRLNIIHPTLTDAPHTLSFTTKRVYRLIYLCFSLEAGYIEDKKERQYKSEDNSNRERSAKAVWRTNEKR